jgi:hypothetical protein
VHSNLPQQHAHALQGCNVSDDIVSAFQDALPATSRRFTDPQSIADGLDVNQPGFTPAEHWAELHQFLQKVLDSLQSMPQHAEAAGAYKTELNRLVQHGRNALEQAVQAAQCAALIRSTFTRCRTAHVASLLHLPATSPNDGMCMTSE